MPSQREVENAKKVRGMLEQIDGIMYDTVREDIFKVTETESGDSLQMTLDVEETTVCLVMDIGPVSDFLDDTGPSEFYQKLLELNDKAVHGKFSLFKNRVLFRDSLEIQNLDLNELEAAMGHMFLFVVQHVPALCAVTA